MAVDRVLLIPGQGAYSPRLFADRAEPEINEVLQVVDRVAAEFGQRGVTQYLTATVAPPAAELAETDPFALQLAVFAVGVIGFRLAARETDPALVVGHSMGEIAALTVAGAFELADGARLVCRRAEALRTGHTQPGSMIALTLPAKRAAHLVDLVAEHGLAVAVHNAPQQTVVSGSADALDTVERLALALGVRSVRLNTPFPFHSPLLETAAELFLSTAAGIRQLALKRPVYSPIAGSYLSNEMDFKALLACHLTSPVHFVQAIRDLHADGVHHFVECCPAGLSELVRRTVPDITTESTLEGARQSVLVASSTQVTPTTQLNADAVVEQLRDLYAATLGYPPEVITAEADLEADLGIDSLKRAEMIAKVTAYYDLADAADNWQLAGYGTLAEVADMVVAARTDIS